MKNKQTNKQNCKKIELYESQTTVALKKKHSFRLVGGREMGRQGGEDMLQGGSWQSHICIWKNWEEQLGSKINFAT